MLLCTRDDLSRLITGKRVALVGSGPGTAENPPGFVDSHDTVIRVNNYHLTAGSGSRCDIHYSFYGRSIKKLGSELKRDGVRVCWAKCPDAQAIESEWHILNRKINGIDFRYIYREREHWWPVSVYIPTVAEFRDKFELLNLHVPTTGFSALLDVLALKPANLFLTGFDFFQSYIHNGKDAWRQNNPSDPIGHLPQLEKAWLKARVEHLPITMDLALSNALVTDPEPPPKRQPSMSRRERLQRLRELEQKKLRLAKKMRIKHRGTPEVA